MELLETTLEPIVKVVDALRNTSGSNDKIKLLRESADIPHLQEILKYTYDPFLKYGVSKKMIEQLENANVNRIVLTPYSDFVDLLDKLAKSNINDQLRVEIASILHHPTNHSTIDLMKCILTKDLKIGMAASNINKAIPGLIPVFDVMRGQKYDDHKKKLIGKNIIVTEKLDGVRAVAMIDADGEVKFFSRQGKEIEGLVEIAADIKKIGLKNIVLDGEVTLLNTEGMESREMFQQTMSIIGSKMEEKKGLLYNVFDCIPMSSFKKGICETTTTGRKKYFEDKWYHATSYPHHVEPLKILYAGKYDEQKVQEIHDKIVEAGGEGVMINIADAPYECKRTSNLLKVKEFYTCDLMIIGYEEGTVGSKNEGKLGAFVVDYKGFNLNVGYGYTEKEREDFWKNRDELIGRVMEVKYFRDTKNKNGGSSVSFGKFVQLREVGKEVSYD